VDQGIEENFADVEILSTQTSTKDEHSSEALIEVKVTTPGGIIIPKEILQETITISQQ
jgi:hypothetical protein